MSEKEKNIIKNLAIAIPKLSKEKQSYILGVAEGMVIEKEGIGAQEAGDSSKTTREAS